MVSLTLADALVIPCSTGGFGLGLRAATTAFPSSACPRGAPLSLRCTPAASTTISGAGRGGALLTRNFAPSNNTIYKVNDFMTKRDDLIVVRPTTTVDKALELLVKNRLSGFPVVDDDWRLVGVVSDYDLLALDSISGCGRRNDADVFPMVDSSWQTFNEIQKLLGKTNGKVVRDLMTPAPLFVHETTNLEDAARLLLETKYRRLPVVGGDGGLVGIITRGHVVRAALKIRHQMGKMTSS